MIGKFVAVIVLVALIFAVYLPLQTKRQAQARRDVSKWLAAQGYADADVSFGDSERTQWRFRVTLPSGKGTATMQKRGRAIVYVPHS